MMRFFELASRALSLVGLVQLASASDESSELLTRQTNTTSSPLSLGIWENLIKNSTDNGCAACRDILTLLKGLAEKGDETFVKTVTEVCVSSKFTDPIVCEGGVALEGPVVAASLRNLTIGSNLSDMMCIVSFGLCDFPEIDEYKVPFPTAKPPTDKKNEHDDHDDNCGCKEEPHGLPPLKIAHFSDIHVDPFYVIGSNTNCSLPMCCRPYTPADAPGNNDFPAPPFGDHNCGSPVSLEESMYAEILKHCPDFAIFTGDIVDHAIWNTSAEHNGLEISQAYQHMADAGMRLVYGTVGNHEASPANNVPPSQWSERPTIQWMYDVVASAWGRWIGAPEGVRDYGAYSVKHPGSNLRIISASTNMYYNLNFWLYKENVTDPSGELAWLVGELDAAERAGERVYLVGHMPMGSPDAFPDASNYFDQIVQRYRATIVNMFFGHTHLDQFEISYSDYGDRNADTATAMSWIAPCMTPLTGNPAFRIYTVDPVTYGIIDAETYYADMGNPDYQTGPVWVKYYSAKEAYGPLVTPPVAADSPDELTPAFWHNVTVALEKDRTAFDQYWTRRWRGYGVPECDDECWKTEICQMRAARVQDNCYKPTPNIGKNFGVSKRDEDNDSDVSAAGTVGAKIDRSQCNKSVAKDTIALLTTQRDFLELLEKRLTEMESTI
ncbi:hypothetical protein CkaCkLH20_02087 [Colletotrichum karsti]|uniref:Sphingomyelin phosphodiesterase n=1 Tax=Colletotrichum karsti TaxID=1095194 RepID=A0A9P6IAH7_9PEZI|nr:uncharacterized protein CkaCkLH20_02087 [Colletotrichum karsti]KAF9880133.1 hypothetical protein CkaCkLH20_02087 [Colletotrichum karsti]